VTKLSTLDAWRGAVDESMGPLLSKIDDTVAQLLWLEAPPPPPPSPSGWVGHIDLIAFLTHQHAHLRLRANDPMGVANQLTTGMLVVASSDPRHAWSTVCRLIPFIPLGGRSRSPFSIYS